MISIFDIGGQDYNNAIARLDLDCINLPLPVGRYLRWPMTTVLNRLFFAGYVRLHILHHAVEESICGVEILAELARHGYRLSPGTVYPVLHDLEKAGYLKSWSKVVLGKKRKYYDATRLGRKALDFAREKLRELADEVLGTRPARRKPRQDTRRSGQPDSPGRRG